MSITATATEGRRTFGPVPDDPADRRLYFMARTKATLRPVERPCLRKNSSQHWVVYSPVDAITAGQHVECHINGRPSRTVFVESVGAPFVRDGARMVYGYIKRMPGSADHGVTHDRKTCTECTPTFG